MLPNGMVTDRTLADVKAGNAKGSYNAEDMNRVGLAVTLIAEQLRLCGFDTSRITAAKMDWKEGDVPLHDDLDAYLDNVKQLQAIVGSTEMMPTLPMSMLRLNYQGANDIEAVLVAIDEHLTLMEKSSFYSGEFFAGEV